MSAKQKKPRRLSGRFAIFITILLFVCTIIFLNTKFSSGSMRRIAYWIFNGVQGDATESSITFDSNEYNKYTVLNGNLCVVAPEKVSSYKLSGKQNISLPVLLRAPSVETSKSYYIAYDLGGLNFYVVNNSKLLFSNTCESKILNVNANKSGKFSVITDGTDCKSLVSIYNDEFLPYYKFHSSDNYVSDAAVSPNGKDVAIITYGAREGSFSSTLCLAHTNENGFYKTADLGDVVSFHTSYLSDRRILVVTDKGTSIYDSDGNLISTVSYDGLSLKAFSTSDKQVAILLDNYSNGGNSKLLFINKIGEKVNEIDFETDIFSISCAGKYTSVQFSDKCVVYDINGETHCEFMIPATVSKCIANKDGSVISIGENYATLFVK